MELGELLGYRYEEALPILISNNLDYKIMETTSVLSKKIGSELRIVNIKTREQLVLVYVSYF